MTDVSHESAEGFTLLEVIVAFVVLSLSLIAINKSVALATTQVRRADEVRKAEELAKQVWADVLLSRDGGVRHARNAPETGLRWELSAKPIDSASKIGITQVTLIVSSESGRRIRDYTTFLPKTVVRE